MPPAKPKRRMSDWLAWGFVATGLAIMAGAMAWRIDEGPNVRTADEVRLAARVMIAGGIVAGPFVVFVFQLLRRRPHANR